MSKQSPNTPPSGDATPIGALTKTDVTQIVGSWPDCPSWCQADRNYSEERSHKGIIGTLPLPFAEQTEPDESMTLTAEQADVPESSLGAFRRLAVSYTLEIPQSRREQVSITFNDADELREFTNGLLGLVAGIEATA